MQCFVFIDNFIWVKVFKNGPSKICGRRVPPTNFTWSILFYSKTNSNSHNFLLTHNALQLLFLFLCSVFGRACKSCLFIFLLLLIEAHVIKKPCDIAYAFIPCALIINNNGGLREHMKSFSSITKSIISPLPKCL